MNKGILNESLLEKEIEQIIFYANEEKTNLRKICNNLIELDNCYNSTNTKIFINNANNLKSKINTIYQKRIKYTNILKKVIINYNTLSNKTVEIFNEDV